MDIRVLLQSLSEHGVSGRMLKVVADDPSAIAALADAIRRETVGERWFRPKYDNPCVRPNEVSTELYNRLVQERLDTVRTLAMLSERDFDDIFRIGTKSIDAIKVVLRKKKMRLRSLDESMPERALAVFGTPNDIPVVYLRLRAPKYSWRWLEGCGIHRLGNFRKFTVKELKAIPMMSDTALKTLVRELHMVEISLLR